MPATTFDRFDGGLDRRKGKTVTDANRLRELKNAHVRTGWGLQKRPGTTKTATLEAGTRGLVAGNGRLNTFYPSGGAVNHANSLFRAHRAAHPSDDARTLARVYRGEVFNGFLYVSTRYDDGSEFHHYLDSDPAWQASTAYSLGDFVEPTTPNGYRFEATTAGTSDAAEPAWPTVVGATVADGTVTWTTRSKAVADANAPHHSSFVKIASKIFSPDPDAEIVRFTATDAPRDWTTSGDAGFLPTGVQATGDAEPAGVGRFRQKLVVSHRDSIQTWAVDPDPTLHALDQVVDVGSVFARSFANISQDLYILSDFGFRSISTLELTGNLQDLDVGSPIDDMVRVDLEQTTDPIALFFNGQGQYWCRMHAGVVWVFTFSRVSKVFAWSRYEFPYTIDAMAELANELYLRSGDDVFKVDEMAFDDDGTEFEVIAELAFQSFKKPGQLKQFLGLDVQMRGSAHVSFKWDPDDETKVTAETLLTGVTTPDEMTDVGVMATDLAVRLRNQDAKDWGLDALTVYYDVLAPL